MPQGKKKINPLETIKPPKTVSISFSKIDGKSPFVLNLPEKLQPPKKETNWEPSALDKLLSNPLKELQPATPKIKLDFPKIKFPTFNLNFSNPRLPSLPPVKKPIIPKTKQKKSWVNFKLPKFNWSVSAKKETPQEKIFLLPSWPRALIGFASIAIILILPLKAFSAYYSLKDTQTDLINSGTSAFIHLNLGKQAIETGDLASATTELQQSLNIFTKAQEEMNSINPVWRSLLSLLPVVGEKVKNGERLMLAGSNLTSAGLPLLYLFNNQNTEISLPKIKETLEEILPRIQETNNNLMAVDPEFIPEDKHEDFQKARQTIFLLNSDLQKIQSLVKNIDEILGMDEPKTYLLIFQNSNEMRPTGGFMGSYAELQIKDGKISRLDIPGEGSYKLQGPLKIAVMPPVPLQFLKVRWEFQDANWFADFPTSAKKIAWFYEKSNGPTVDGVIALDTKVLTDLLNLAGPLELPQYKKTLTPQNAITEIQQQVEVDYDKVKNRPKQILSDLAPVLLQKLLSDKTNLLPLLGILNKDLTQKHIQVFLTDKESEKNILSQGWGGEVKDNAKGDFLMVVNSNVGADKTDGVITQTIKHITEIGDDGSLVDTITITRAHNGPNKDLFTDRENIDYIRFYVPEGSQLLSATGFDWPEENQFKVPGKMFKLDQDLAKIEQGQSINSQNGTVITQEFGKTAFGNWILTKPGQESTATISYRLPFKLTPPKIANWQAWLQKVFKESSQLLSYSLLVQKQPGTFADQFTHSVLWPGNWKPLWTEPDNLTWQNNQLTYQTDLLEDRFWGLIFENQN